MDQLKKALMKAGLATSQPKPEEKHKKSFSPQKESKKFHEHQMRTECEYCKKYAPDVEYYMHDNKFVEVRWLCMHCADEYRILDNCRQTHQSVDARSGRFIRQYGATKKFS
jgi:hypothetical protein